MVDVDSPVEGERHYQVTRRHAHRSTEVVDVDSSLKGERFDQEIVCAGPSSNSDYRQPLRAAA